MTIAYILLTVGVAVWAALVPVGKRFSDSVLRSVTVFGGAFLLGVCFLGLLPEMSEMFCFYHATKESMALLPYAAVLAGFLIQQLLGSLTAHAEHGHIESGKLKSPVVGLMIGLGLHAFLEGMPLVEPDGSVNSGLLYGILIHNIPVSLILVGLMTARGMGFWRVLAMLTLFGLMSPLGSLFNLMVVQPDEDTQRIIIGLVVGVLLHVSSSILFDHKQYKFSWLNIGLIVLAFTAAFFTIH